MAVKVQLSVRITDQQGTKISLSTTSLPQSDDQLVVKQSTYEDSGVVGNVLLPESSVIGSGLSMPLPA